MSTTTIVVPLTPTARGLTVTAGLVDGAVGTSGSEYRQGPAGVALDSVILFNPLAAPGDNIADELEPWLSRFMPSLPPALQHPAVVDDRDDPKLAHLDGLNLSRAWCMRSLAAALPPGNALRSALVAAAAEHTHAGLANVTTGSYAGEHWLASFAVYLLGTP
jgi:hypothetical protein